MRCPFTILLFLFYITTACSAAERTFTYTGNCKKAYHELLSMHFEEARRILATEQKDNPINLLPVYLADYEDCIRLILHADPSDYQKRIGHFDQRLNTLSQGDRNSPWYRFCRSGIYLHWAIINIRFNEQYKAAMNFRRSFSLLKENQQLFPSWEYNNVFAGLQRSVVGSLPPSYKWLASVFGLSGSIKDGAGMLANFVNTHNSESPVYDEAVLYYIYVRFYLLNEQKEVWNFLNSAQFQTMDNLLNTFVKVNVAIDYRKADDAIRALNMSANSSAYNSYPIFFQMMGSALLSRCDTASVEYFNRFLSKSKSGLYIKDSWQKMGYAWYINDDTRRAYYCMAQVKEQGTTRIDADRQAERFAQKNVWPNKSLLRARLLIDGGYYDKALTVLNTINYKELVNPADQSEYYFRMGRVYEEMGRNTSAQHYKTALANYSKAIELGKERHEQFAARAALNMGKIYEELDLGKEALASFKECLDMPSHDFQNTIDQQAKAGINRVEGK